MFIVGATRRRAPEERHLPRHIVSHPNMSRVRRCSSVRSVMFIVGTTQQRAPEERHVQKPAKRLIIALLRALELAGEKIIHHQGREVGRNPKILLRIVVLHAEPELIAAVD